ncbi:hypothetical protein B0J18DRAFT_453413 [Chaetomium sp. MPI-SDFR-AT-0129]|nr:hypothetical protein B0J18DRAFT_453413 [Chaetomium sp. MPI-SDFR-AT-0129]
MPCSSCRKPRDRCKCSSPPCGPPRPVAVSSRRAAATSAIPAHVRASEPPISVGSPSRSSSAGTTGTSPSRGTNYSNVNYADGIDLSYDNTGAPYNPATARLTASQERLSSDLSRSGGRLSDLGDRFSALALDTNKHGGNHIDVPTYGRDRQNRTPSDTTMYGKYKEDQKKVPAARRAALDSKRAAPVALKTLDPEAHIGVASKMDAASSAYSAVADDRMAHMEQYPYGLADLDGKKSHLLAAGESLHAAVDMHDQSRRHLQLARDKQTSQQADAWSHDPSAGSPYYDRPASTASLHSSGSSKVSSGRTSSKNSSGTSKPPPLFSSGSKIKGQCQYTDRNGRQCNDMTSKTYCSKHR